MIIEIEGRFDEAESPAGSSTKEAWAADLQAIDFHLQSLTEDEGPCTIITPAHEVKMGKFDAPAYRLHARIELANDPDAEDHGEEPAVTSCHMFFTRLEKQEADLVVWVNVPGVVIGNSSAADAVDERDDIATAILDKFCESFELRGSGEWKVVEDGFTMGPHKTEILLKVDRKMGEDSDELQGQRVVLGVKETDEAVRPFQS